MEQFDERGERPAPEGVPTLNVPMGCSGSDREERVWLDQGVCECGALAQYGNWGAPGMCIPCAMEAEITGVVR